MYLNFSNFGGRTSAGGGDKPWSKNGDKYRMGGGGLAKFLLDVGTLAVGSMQQPYKWVLPN